MISKTTMIYRNLRWIALALFTLYALLKIWGLSRMIKLLQSYDISTLERVFKDDRFDVDIAKVNLALHGTICEISSAPNIFCLFLPFGLVAVALIFNLPAKLLGIMRPGSTFINPALLLVLLCSKLLAIDGLIAEIPRIIGLFVPVLLMTKEKKIESKKLRAYWALLAFTVISLASLVVLEGYLYWVAKLHLPMKLSEAIQKLVVNGGFDPSRVLKTTEPGAFAMGYFNSYIFFNVNSAKTDDEIAAILLHEMTHVRNWDVLTLSSLSLIRNFLYGLFSFCLVENESMRNAILGIASTDFITPILSEFPQASTVGLAPILTEILVGPADKLFLQPIALYVSRLIEYRADRSAAAYPFALVNALMRMVPVSIVCDPIFEFLAASHPGHLDRFAALKARSQL